MLRKSNLDGFRAPNMEYQTVVSMFANDTTAFLTKNNNYSLLQSILKKWCTASGAKFNTAKTEIIPVGSPAYCEALHNAHILNPNLPPLPEDLRIAKDGTAIRILGAWLGNNTHEHTIWFPILEKIDDSLDRWERTHPSIEGRKTIIQWMIGSMIQYLTKAQGMPMHIEQLEKKIKSFIWDDEGRPTISIEMMYAPSAKVEKRSLT